MRKGNEVVCIDDSLPWMLKSNHRLKKDKIYEILDTSHSPNGRLNLLVNDGSEGFWDASRFKKVTPKRRGNSVTRKLCKIQIVEEKSDYQKVKI